MISHIFFILIILIKKKVRIESNRMKTLKMNQKSIKNVFFNHFSDFRSFK